MKIPVLLFNGCMALYDMCFVFNYLCKGLKSLVYLLEKIHGVIIIHNIRERNPNIKPEVYIYGTEVIVAAILNNQFVFKSSLTTNQK